MSITSIVNDLVTSVSVVNALKPLPPTISGYSVAGKDDLALDPAGGQTVQINGTGFLPGATITFDGSAVSVVTYVNPNQLTFTSPAKSAGTYTIYVVNSDGGTAIYVPGIIYSTLPTWTTAAGSLGSYYETTSISNTVVAAGDAPVTYSLYSGSLPTGSTLSANGVITGTAPVDSSSTTYSFTIQASDAQLQDSTRSFSLTINVDAVTWVSPANNTTYTSAANSAISTVTLSATDAAGYAVSYSANALPTGLSLSGANITGTPTVIADSSTLLTATAATTNRSATRTINWSITVANDTYFEYNTLLIPGASTTFVDDASTNNFAVTINGDTKPNNFNPYTPGYYSNYFDGNGDYLTVPSSANFTLPGDFTIECWIYVPSVSQTIQRIFSSNAGPSGGCFFSVGNDIGTGAGAGKLCANGHLVSPYTSGLITAPTAIPTNTWIHAALVRSGSTITIYQNGVSVASATDSATWDFNNGAGVRISGTPWAGTAEDFGGYISNLRVVKGTAVYTSNFTPSTTPLTAIANTSLLTCQSNRFIDNSTNNFTLTVFGNTSINSFDPFVPNSSYSSYGSGYFDGTGDYLTVPYNAAISLGSGDFTFDMWIYPTVATRSTLYLESGDRQGIFIDYNNGNNGISVFATATSGSWSIINGDPGNPGYGTSNTIKINTWTHFAFVRSGTNWSTYINGVRDLNITASGTVYEGNGTRYISYFPANGLYLNGYMSNFRLVKGTALYSGATLTVPTAPLTAVSGTGLLTLQNNQSVNNSVFLDNSSNNFLVTRAGNTTQGTFSPYGGNWSNYFDGASDYIRKTGSGVLTASGDVTIECWIYPLTTTVIGLFDGGSGEVLIIRNYGNNKIAKEGQESTGATFTVTANTWQHFACTFTNGNIKVFINGSLNASGSYSGGYAAGSNFDIGTINGGSAGSFNGYISNFRVTKSVLYTTTFTPSTTPLTPITNTSLLTCQSNSLIDNSINNFTITKNGDTSVQRFSPFNPSSLTPTSYSGYFGSANGNSLYLSAQTSGTGGVALSGNYTMEMWLYPTAASGSGYSMLIATNTNGGVLQFYYNSSGNLGYYSPVAGQLTTSSAPLTFNAWQHVALVRSSNVVKVYVNGVEKAFSSTITDSSTVYANYIGGLGTVYNTFGYISNLRVNNTAIYTTTFTPSTTPLTAISGTQLLTLQSATFIDNSTNNYSISVAGSPQPTIQNPFGFTSATTNGYTPSTIGGSAYFTGGSGQYLDALHSSQQWLSNGNFTIECWFYVQQTSENTLVSKQWQGSSNAYASYLLYTNSSRVLQALFNTGGGWDVQLTGTTTIILNQWNHAAVNRTGNTWNLYLNGKLEATTTNSGTLVNATDNLRVGAQGAQTGAGASVLGYVSDLRITKGVGLYPSQFVPPSTPMVAVPNTMFLLNSTSAGVYDAAMMTTMETVGDAKLSTAVSKFGGSSMSFDGTGDYLVPSAPNSNLNLVLGTGNFTIEFWVYFNSGLGSDIVLYDSRPLTTNGVYPTLYVNSSSQLSYVVSGTDQITSGSAFSATTWYHVALCRSSTSTKMFINGTQVGSTYTDSNNYLNPARRPVIAINGYNETAAPLNGYIDDLRVTKGYARYTSNFTAPTTAFPVY